MVLGPPAVGKHTVVSSSERGKLSADLRLLVYVSSSSMFFGGFSSGQKAERRAESCSRDRRQFTAVPIRAARRAGTPAFS